MLFRSMLDNSCNGEKTFGIVYKGSADVIEHNNKPQYFRSRLTARRILPMLESIFIDSNLEIIQFNLTAKERYDFAKKKDLARITSKKAKKGGEMANKSITRGSRYLSHLKKDQKEYQKQQKMEKIENE